MSPPEQDGEGLDFFASAGDRPTCQPMPRASRMFARLDPSWGHGLEQVCVVDAWIHVAPLAASSTAWPDWPVDRWDYFFRSNQAAIAMSASVSQ